MLFNVLLFFQGDWFDVPLLRPHPSYPDCSYLLPWLTCSSPLDRLNNNSLPTHFELLREWIWSVLLTDALPGSNQMPTVGSSYTLNMCWVSDSVLNLVMVGPVLYLHSAGPNLFSCGPAHNWRWPVPSTCPEKCLLFLLCLGMNYITHVCIGPHVGRQTGMWDSLFGHSFIPLK